MRLFTAIELDAATLKQVGQTLGALRPTASIQWSRPENLHITTKFIGEFPEARLEELKRTLQPAARCAPLKISMGGFGWFPDERDPRALVAKVDGGNELPALAKAIEEALAALGIERDRKRYSPHLTLARIKRRAVLDGLRLAVGSRQNAEFGCFEASCFWLYRSQPAEHGSVYTKLASFPFES